MILINEAICQTKRIGFVQKIKIENANQGENSQDNSDINSKLISNHLWLQITPWASDCNATESVRHRLWPECPNPIQAMKEELCWSLSMTYDAQKFKYWWAAWAPSWSNRCSSWELVRNTCWRRPDSRPLAYQIHQELFTLIPSGKFQTESSERTVHSMILKLNLDTSRMPEQRPSLQKPKFKLRVFQCLDDHNSSRPEHSELVYSLPTYPPWPSRRTPERAPEQGSGFGSDKLQPALRSPYYLIDHSFLLKVGARNPTSIDNLFHIGELFIRFQG